MNRARLRPWGVAGGHPGYLGGAILNPGTPGEQRIAKITVLSLKRGDVVRLTTPAGGGFGDPFDREPERVLRSEEHRSELQSLMRISYAVFCLKKNTHRNTYPHLYCVRSLPH